LKINYKTVFYIILVSCLLGLATNFLNPAEIPLLKEERKLAWVTDSKEVKDQSTSQNPGTELTEAKAITLKKAYELYKSNAVFVDARDYVEYEISHIKGAISLPYVEFDKYKSVLDSIPKNTPLVAYCDGKECDLSIMLGDKLFETGYKEVYIFFGGWIDWQQANYPIDKEQAK
jgi:rhodanese-related sulfurtransferase